MAPLLLDHSLLLTPITTITMINVQGQKSSYNAQEKTTTVYWRGVSRKEEMKLSRELGHQPRQIVIWFQCRRAEWKAKQLERLYDTLKHDYDVISREKQKLQDEVNYLAQGLMDNVQNPDSLSMHSSPNLNT
ncbi:hypothetical protein ES332_A09G169700v1 [Gossypium tomentosum]|uniref:Homeobox-leucine zipper protein n=1 Tax=Gossypium tomentosum TaxID=34277 RepID=A0A5D2P4U2_GOSTO|nr:hypothetical protein ES332_A09G169700v1 [Gossypium tomentosum]